MPESKINARTVISAVWALNLGPTSRYPWPTAEHIAKHLKTEEAVVLGHLRDLKAQRLMKDRRRKGERVWMPWSEVS